MSFTLIFLLSCCLVFFPVLFTGIRDNAGPEVILLAVIIIAAVPTVAIYCLAKLLGL